MKKAATDSLSVLYLNGGNSITVSIGERDYGDVRSIEQGVESDFIAQGGSDDFWVDNIVGKDVDGDALLAFLAPNGRLVQEAVSIFFEDTSDFLFPQIEALVYWGMDITEDNLDEVRSWEITDDDYPPVEGNYEGSTYPAGWLYDYAGYTGNFPPMIMDNWSYFRSGVARMVSDDEVNGVMDTVTIGDFFFWYFR